MTGRAEGIPVAGNSLTVPPVAAWVVEFVVEGEMADDMIKEVVVVKHRNKS